MRKLKNGNWTQQLMVDGNRFSITCPTKAELQLKMLEYKTGRTIKSTETVRQCVRKYIDLSEGLSPTTLQAYEKTFAYGFQHIMDLPIDKLNNVVLQNAINVEAKRKNERTGKPLSAKTVKNEWSLISSALKTIANKSFRVKLPKIPPKNKILPEPEVVMAILKGSNVELPSLLAMWCGLRISEIRGLTFDSVHDDYISIDKVMVDVNNKPLLKPMAKTDLSIRKVILPNYIKELIKSQNGAKNDLVVPLTRNAIYHRFTRLMRKNNIKLSFHDLRHEYASVMLTKLHIPEKIVQKGAGWKTDFVMKSVYSNTFTNSELEASRLRDEFYELVISNPNKELEDGKMRNEYFENSLTHD